MFERFTDEARHVFVDAVTRAREERAADVREEHLLAAVLAARSSAELVSSCGLEQPRAAAVLAEIRTVRRRLTRRRNHLPVSAGAQAALERARCVSAARGDSEVGAAHLLLGLLTPPGLVADVLYGHGVTIAAVLAYLDAHPGTGGRRAS